MKLFAKRSSPSPDKKTMLVGLGNPGKKYLLTPHNIGWLVVDALAQACEVHLKEKKIFLVQSSVLENHNIILLKPLTFMNLSGQAVRQAMNYYGCTLDQLLIIHDDLDLPFLSMKFQKNRGPAGHNGLHSINQELNSQNYTRLRIGMSHRDRGKNKNADQVLRVFSKQEQRAIQDFLSDSVSAIRYFLRESLEKTASRYNS